MKILIKNNVLKIFLTSIILFLMNGCDDKNLSTIEDQETKKEQVFVCFHYGESEVGYFSWSRSTSIVKFRKAGQDWQETELNKSTVKSLNGLLDCFDLEFLSTNGFGNDVLGKGVTVVIGDKLEVKQNVYSSEFEAGIIFRIINNLRLEHGSGESIEPFNEKEKELAIKVMDQRHLLWTFTLQIGSICNFDFWE